MMEGKNGFYQCKKKKCWGGARIKDKGGTLVLLRAQGGVGEVWGVRGKLEECWEDSLNT